MNVQSSWPLACLHSAISSTCSTLVCVSVDARAEPNRKRKRKRKQQAAANTSNAREHSSGCGHEAKIDKPDWRSNSSEFTWNGIGDCNSNGSSIMFVARVGHVQTATRKYAIESADQNSIGAHRSSVGAWCSLPAARLPTLDFRWPDGERWSHESSCPRGFV